MLALSLEAIDVYPPRATALGKLFQPKWRLRVLARRIALMLDAVREWNWGRTDDAAHLDLATVLHAVIPGWANSYAGKRFEGTVFFAAYLAAGILGLLMLGTEVGAILLGIAFAIHIASVVKAIVPRFESFRDRIMFTGVTAGALAVMIYWPASSVFSRVAVPLSINQSLPPFFAGDVIWYHPTSNVQAGQFVLYDSAEFRTSGRAVGRHAQLVVEGGLRISRVVAMTGQTLSWDQGKMLIDGKVIDPPWLPTNYESLLQNVTVPEGQILIDPTNLIPGGGFGMPVTGEVHGQPSNLEVHLDPGISRNLALVPANSVVGVIVCRTWPWSRASLIY